MQNRSFKLNSINLIMHILKNVCLQSHILKQDIKTLFLLSMLKLGDDNNVYKKIKKSYLFDLFNLLFNDK